MVSQTEPMTPSIAVIILNYKRPQNIGAIVRAARAALPEAAIFILDQAETDTLRERNDIPWGEVWLQRAEENTGAGARVPLASWLPFDFYIAIDDDVFLTPEQIGQLAERLRAEPDRAHGIWGQRLELDQGQIRYRNSLNGVDAAVSILNEVYAFSRGQATAALELSARLGFSSWRDVRVGNDIVLSCASPKPPLCHDLGPLEHCPTSGEPGIAVWKSEGFKEQRLDIVRRLLAIQAIAVFTPLAFSGEAT
jgi:hypothetical protein